MHFWLQTQMLASALIVLSLTVTVLAVLDFLLSETQKKLVADTVIATWNILDEARKWSFSDWLKNPRASWWFAISFGLSAALSQAAMMPTIMKYHELAGEGFPRHAWIPLLFLGAVSGLIFTLITRPIFSRLLKLGKRLWYVLIVASALYGLAFTSLAYSDTNSDLQTFGLAVYLVVGMPTGILLMVLFMIFFARFLAYIASGVLFVGELIVRRIAEYPKGPIIAISAIFGGVVSLVKIFSG